MPSFAARWLLPRLAAFVALHRDIDLDVRSSMALVDFRRDDTDVAIRYGFGQLAGRQGRVPARRRILSRMQSAARIEAARAAARARASHVAALGRRTMEAVVRGGRPRLARACARTDLQRFRADAAGRGGRAGRRARAQFAARQRRSQRPARAPVRHRCSGAAKILLVYPPRLAASPKLALFRRGCWPKSQKATRAAARLRGSRDERGGKPDDRLIE